MKIDYCLLSSDENPFYLDFWPLVSKVWKLRFKIEPILIFIGKVPIPNYYGTVILQPPIPDINLPLQSQWASIAWT